MVEAGALNARAIWERLDPGAPPIVMWALPARSDRVTILLGAFDPPTVAHLAVLEAAAASDGSAPAFGMTKVLLDRGPDRLLSDGVRMDLLEAVASRVGAGLLLANRGTYLEVHRAVVASGVSPRFLIGADKLTQLADASFYADGQRGVDATFDEVPFVIVPRAGSAIPRRDVTVLDIEPSDVSATEVRAMFRRGSPVDHLVPPEVLPALAAIGLQGEGYTSGR